jgi:hypothetical protein
MKCTMFEHDFDKAKCDDNLRMPSRNTSCVAEEANRGDGKTPKEEESTRGQLKAGGEVVDKH